MLVVSENTGSGRDHHQSATGNTTITPAAGSVMTPNLEIMPGRRPPATVRFTA